MRADHPVPQAWSTDSAWLAPMLPRRPLDVFFAPRSVAYVQPWRLPDGRDVLIRPIRPEDELLLAAFHRSLSAEGVYLRYSHPLSLEQRAAHDRLIYRCAIDYDREMALVAEETDGSGGPTLLGVGRWTRAHAASEAEFALIVEDASQHQGLGTELLRRLIQSAWGGIMPLIRRHLARKLGDAAPV